MWWDRTRERERERESESDWWGWYCLILCFACLTRRFCARCSLIRAHINSAVCACVCACTHTLPNTPPPPLTNTPVSTTSTRSTSLSFSLSITPCLCPSLRISSISPALFPPSIDEARPKHNQHARKSHPPTLPPPLALPRCPASCTSLPSLCLL